MITKLLKKIGAFSLGPVVGSLFSFITVPVTTYFILPEEYGKASMFILAQSLLSFALYMGLDQAYIREYHTYKDKNKLLQNAVFYPLIFVVVMDLVIYVFQSPMAYFLFEDADEHLGVYALMILLPFMVIEHFALFQIRMEEKGVLYSSFLILLKFLILTFTLLLIFFYEKTFRAVIFAVALAQIIDGTILFFLKRKNLIPERGFLDKTLIKRMFRFGLPLIPAAIIGLALNSMDKIMLRSLSTFSELGIYAAALKIVTLLGIIQQSFTLFWTPTAFRWFAEKKKRSLFHFVGESTTLFMVIVCLLILLLKEVIVLVLGPEYNQAIYILPFLLLYPIMYTISEVTTLGIAFTGKTEYNILVSIVAAIVNIALNFTLIPLYGGYGAALATGISYVVFFWTRTLISKKLWMKTPLTIYGIYTIIVVANTWIHSLYHGILPYAISGVSLLLILLIHGTKIIGKGKKIKKQLEEDELEKQAETPVSDE